MYVVNLAKSLQSWRSAVGDIHKTRSSSEAQYENEAVQDIMECQEIANSGGLRATRASSTSTYTSRIHRSQRSSSMPSTHMNARMIRVDVCPRLTFGTVHCTPLPGLTTYAILFISLNNLQAGRALSSTFCLPGVASMRYFTMRWFIPPPQRFKTRQDVQRGPSGA